MKRFTFYTLAFIILGGTFINAPAQEMKSKKQKRQQQFQKTVSLVEDGNFIFEANRAFPQGGPSVDLTTNYGFLKVNDSIAVADLPYFGRAYRVKYGGDGGIKFTGKTEDLNNTQNPEKMRIIYSFDVKDNDVYRVTMDIGYDGNASLSIISNDRSSIRYAGKVSLPEPENQE